MKKLKLRSNNKGVSSVIAASILLAALVTVAVTYQAFIVPELDREKAFTHSQDVLYSFKKLYSEGTATIPLSYAGTPFFSSTTFTGQLSYTPLVTIRVDVNSATEVNEEETLLSETATIHMQSLSDASLYFENVADNVEATCSFTSSEEQTVFQVHTEKLTVGNETTLIRIQLGITHGSVSAYYNYSVFSGDTLNLPLLSPLYGLASTLHKTSQVQYTTNSSSCLLFLKYRVATTANLSYTSSGAIRYEPSNFPLSYVATPWGITAIEGGTSAIPSPLQIYWTKDTLVLDLYNTTWSNIGTVSGSGSVGLKFETDNSISVDSTFSRVDMNFSFSEVNLKNSVLQLEAILQSGAPEGTVIYHQEGDNGLTITIEGTSSINMLIRNIEAVLG